MFFCAGGVSAPAMHDPDRDGPRKPRRFRAVFYVMPCRCPETGERREARIGRLRALQVAEDGPPYRAHELRWLVPETLAQPDAIHRYIADAWEGWCFALSASYRLRNDGTRTAPLQGGVFLVFLTSGLLITEWGWEHADPHDPARPLRHDGRLGPAVYVRERT